jgi:hypothetical protein
LAFNFFALEISVKDTTDISGEHNLIVVTAIWSGFELLLTEFHFPRRCRTYLENGKTARRHIGS